MKKTSGNTEGRPRPEQAALRARVGELEAAHAKARKDDIAERRLEDRLAALVEITNELSTTESVDVLCRRAVELGRQRLGFDRLGIWFREGESDMVLGTFGVDGAGNIVDERDRITRLDPNTPDGRVLLSQEPLVLVQDGGLPEGGSEATKGMQAFAAIWDGRRVIGHVSTDNRLRLKPITERDCRLLRLFGSAIGYLCARKRVEEERERLIAELQDAVAQINTLSGLIPICSLCRRIRNDRGYWEQLEEFVRQKSNAQFTHGYCPDCAAKIYADLEEKERRDAAGRARPDLGP